MSGTHIVIGATGGIGGQLARRLHAGGARLHLIGRDAGRLGALADELEASQTTADVLDEAALEAAIAACPGDIAGLAYCVGSIDLCPLQRLAAETMLASYRLNVVGAALAVRAAAPRMVEGAGVVLFSSVAAQQGFLQHAPIAAAKAAVEGLARSLAADLAPKVRVNVVAPSLTRTPLAARFTSSEAMQKAIAQLHALPRLGEADDAAALAAFLLGSDAGWITGQVLAVDGGRSTVRSRG
jgi:NAD(P)-dependent dehydrogenase (short-subunit alcohol dehydrogenase family)